MVSKREKYISKSNYKDILNKIITDISKNDLSNYYVRRLEWYDNYFRIRKWNIRIVFEKWIKENKIVAVDTRWNIYRWLK